MKYLTCEDRLCIVYAYHFIFLHQIRNLSYHPPHQRICISHFLHSLFEMCERMKKGKHDVLAHHGLVKLIIFQILQELTSPLSWARFTYSWLGKEGPFEKKSTTPTPSPYLAQARKHHFQRKLLKKKRM